MPKAKVYLIGAGPGDKGLMTVKGLENLSQADVVLYDHLIPLELLSCAADHAEKISVGKFAGNHTMPQEEINSLIVEKAASGKTVARLKGGDCYLFGRGGEEALACYDAGIDFEVIPGITSALAVPCYGGIPATQRGLTTSIAVVTGHRKKGDDRPIDIPRADTVIFLMSVGNIQNIIDSLIKAGWSTDTNIAAVEHGTCYDQQVVKGTLADFIEKIENNPLRTPAIFIVGRVVELQDKLDWFARKPKILHLGSNPERYSHLGTIVHRQIIKCVEVESDSQTDNAIKDSGNYDWIVFTSGNGIKYFFKKLHEAGFDARIFANTKFAVIGKASSERLLEYGVKADICSAVESSEGLLEEFRKMDIDGLRFLLPQAQVSSEKLSVGLEKKGSTVDRLVVYKTVETEIEDVELTYIDQIIFTSSSTIRAFVKKYGSVPSHIQSFCMGKPTQTTALENGINAQILEKKQG